jgi:uncharacterized protein YoxC
VIATVGHAVAVGAAVAAAIAWVFVAAFVAYALVQVAVVLRTTTLLIDDIRKETVPLLHEVTGTVSGVNKELDRVDGMVQSAGNIVKSAERISTVVENAVSSPLIKVAALGAGVSRAVRRLRKKREK